MLGSMITRAPIYANLGDLIMVLQTYADLELTTAAFINPAFFEASERVFSNVMIPNLMYIVVGQSRQ